MHCRVGQGTAGKIPVEENKWISVLTRGIDLGMTLIDTAEAYLDGFAEKVVGKAISGKRDQVFLCTKVSPEHADKCGTIHACEQSLRRLGTDHVDCYFIHWPSTTIPLEETVEAFMALRQQGKIRHYGLSNFGLAAFKPLREKHGDVLWGLELEYNLTCRLPEDEILPLAESDDFMFLAYTPLRMPQHGQDVLTRIARKYDCSIQQLAIRWVMRYPNAIPIPMTFAMDHVQQNAAAANLEISNQDLFSISERFSATRIMVAPSLIRIASGGDQSVYTTLEEAVANPANLSPSPLAIAEDFRNGGEALMPVKLIVAENDPSGAAYYLVQGRVRYWGWVIAFGWERPIPALILP